MTDRYSYTTSLAEAQEKFHNSSKKQLWEKVISKTNYGLDIFAFVLRKVYPNDTVIELVGEKTKPTKNPFFKNRCTLQLKRRNGEFYFSDTIDNEFNGDAFAFVYLFIKYKCASEAKDMIKCIPSYLDAEMQLYIATDRPVELTPYQKQDELRRSYPKFSFFRAPIKNTIPTREINIIDAYHMIHDEERKSKTDTLRSLSDKKQKREFKSSQLDYITFSGTFSRRNDITLLKHSSYMVIDFDHLENIHQVRQKLLDDQCIETALLFTSPSGDGLKWIIEIELSEISHQEYFQAVSNYIMSNYQLEVDSSGKDISRACFLCHDPNVFINKKYR